MKKRLKKITGLSLGFRSTIYFYVLRKAESRWWVVSRLTALLIVIVYLSTGFSFLPLRTDAAGNHDFVRTISKDITPDLGSPFSIGEIDSMVIDADGYIYAAKDSTIYKLSSSGAYVAQWEANGAIGILNYDKVSNLIYKTGENGIQIFTTEGLEAGSVPVNGGLVRGGGSSPKWYGVGTSSGPATDLKSVTSDYLFVYDSNWNLTESYDLNSYSWPEGDPILSISSYYVDGVVDSIYLGGPGRISSIRPNGIQRQVWEDGTGTTSYDSIVVDSRGNLYASDDNQDIIRKFDKDVQPLMEWGGLGSGDLEFDDPGEIAVSQSGNVYIDDVGNGSLKQYSDNLSIEITSPERIPGYIRPNTYFSFTVETDNVSDDLTFSIIDGDGNDDVLPDGLSLNTSTGEISGTLGPSVELTDFIGVFRVKVTSSNGSYDEETISLYGADSSLPISLQADVLPNMEYGSTINYSTYPMISITGGQEYAIYPIEYSIVDGSLPTGLTLEPRGSTSPPYNEARISGRPSASGLYTFTVRAESTDPLSPGFDEEEYTIRVLPEDEPIVFAHDGVGIPIVKVRNAIVRGDSTTISGSGPINQTIKIYMDGEEIGIATSGEDGNWNYEVEGLNGMGHSFNASWEANDDIAFILGSDNSYSLQHQDPKDFYSSVQIFDTNSGRIIKNLVMPPGFYATQVVPNSDSSKLYLSGIDTNNYSNNPNNARILEYDVASGSLNFVTDLNESLDGLVNLLVSSDGSALYALNSSGLYSIDTSTDEVELISRLNIKNFAPAGRAMDFTNDGEKIVIADYERINYTYSYGHFKRMITVDLLSGVSSEDEVFVAGSGGPSGTFAGQSFVAKGNGNIYLAYRDGTVKIVNEQDNSVTSVSFNINPDANYNDDPVVWDIVGGYFYDVNEDAIYALVLSTETPSSGPVQVDYTLRKLSIDTGVVEYTYSLPFLPLVGLLSRDAKVFYFFDNAQSALRSGVYKIDLVTGFMETIDERVDSLPSIPASQGGPVVRSFMFVPSKRNIVGDFSVFSNTVIGELFVDDEPEKPTNPPSTEEPNDPSEENTKDKKEPILGIINSLDKSNTSSGAKSGRSDLNDGGASSLRDLIDKLAGSLGVSSITLAKVFPWAVIFLLFGLILIILLSLIKQLIVVSKMKKLVRRQELLNLEKTWLLSLSSHYLRTPLTIIQSGQEMLTNRKIKSKLIKGMSGLSLTVSRVVDNLRNDSVVAEMKAPEKRRYKHASFWQPKVVVPVVLTLSLVIALNSIFVYGADLYTGALNISAQVLMVVLGGALLYLVYDTWAEKQALEKYQGQLLVYEEGLDKVRNKFVLSMANDLMPEIKKARKMVTTEVPLKARKNLNKGLDQLERTTDKFLLICQLEREELKKQAAELGLKGTIEKAREQSKHPKSPVKLLLSDESTLSQPEVLLKKVFASLIDNAAEHSNSKKPVKIYSDEGNLVKVSVQDYGKGIDEDKLSLLFKPLSKVEEDFTSQGMGLSLYLNRLIMHYLNGEIKATSTVGVGTTMIVEVPKHLT